jgi:hypothetical protein
MAFLKRQAIPEKPVNCLVCSTPLGTMGENEKDACYDCADCEKHYRFPAWNKKPVWVKQKWRCETH